jgi:uncharacterized protein (DUF486 family)
MFSKGIWSIILLIISNIFMTLAWYKHLYLDKGSLILKWGLPLIILLSWGLAFFEYLFQVPANRIGHDQHGGPFNLIQLRIIQEVISLTVFTLIAIFVFKSIKLNWNHFAAFICLILAVWFVFRK